MHRNGMDTPFPGSAARPMAVNGAAILDADRGRQRCAALPRYPDQPAPGRDNARKSMGIGRVVVVVLLPFVSGYYLSYLYRTIAALISEPLVSQLALSPANLGFLTSTYFLAFALIQLPLGVWLDRFGPRRVQAMLLSIAACGAALFAAADGLMTLAFGRALIGLGVAGALMAGLKAIVLWFPAERIALANGWFIMLGALGAVTATAPAELLLAAIGWRGVFALLGALTAASALLILLVVPERKQAPSTVISHEVVSIASVYRDSRFWRLAPLSATCIGSAWALQGLWAAPWLADVEGLERPAVVSHLLMMAIALSASALLLGAGADRLRRRGVSLQRSFAVATGIALVAQLALVLGWPVPAWLPWMVIAGIGAATVLSYAILSDMFPRSASGRANGALNLLHVGVAFAVQYAIGLVVQQWPGEAGHYPAAAYQTALGLSLAVQTAAYLWFVRPHRQIVARHLGPHTLHTLAARLGIAPATAVPYALARRAWANRMADALAQQRAWRSAALASLAALALVCSSLGTTLTDGAVAWDHAAQNSQSEPFISTLANAGVFSPAAIVLVMEKARP